MAKEEEDKILLLVYLLTIYQIFQVEVEILITARMILKVTGLRRMIVTAVKALTVYYSIPSGSSKKIKNKHRKIEFPRNHVLIKGD